MSDWLALDAPRPVLDGTYVSRPGIFAWDRIDPASKLLASLLPETLKGRSADLGAGFGYLARAVLEKGAECCRHGSLRGGKKRALDLAEQNLAAFKGKKRP
ncbi:methyltransferase [Roseibium salinum]|nr:methyltransferase [Roseibium salinum]